MPTSRTPIPPKGLANGVLVPARGAMTGVIGPMTGVKGAMMPVSRATTGVNGAMTGVHGAMTAVGGTMVPVNRAPTRPRSVLAAACLATFPVAAWAQIQLHTIGGLNGGTYVQTASISRDGRTAVGLAYNADQTESYAFGWFAGVGTRNLGWLGPDINSLAQGVSADGRVIVGWSIESPSTPHAFRWTAETGMQDLGVLPGEGRRGSSASCVSADGRVVVGGASGSLFRWTAETGLVDLGPGPAGSYSIERLSDDGETMIIIGGVSGYTSNHLYSWSLATGLTEIGVVAPPERRAFITDVTMDHTAVGYLQIAPEVYRAFRWRPPGPGGGLEILDVFGTHAFPSSISDDGSVMTGFYFTDGMRYTIPFMWTTRGGAVDVTQRFAALGVDLGGRRLQDSMGVSGDGRSVFGTAFDPQSLAFVATFACAADRTLDGIVDFFDYLWFVEDFEEGTPAADINKDGFVDFFDYDAFVEAFEAGC